MSFSRFTKLAIAGKDEVKDRFEGEGEVLVVEGQPAATQDEELRVIVVFKEDQALCQTVVREEKTTWEARFPLSEMTSPITTDDPVVLIGISTKGAAPPVIWSATTQPDIKSPRPLLTAERP